MLKMIGEYKSIDPGFDISFFNSKLTNVFRRLKICASDGKMEEIQPYLTESYYEKAVSDINTLAKNNRLVYTDRITVLGSQIVGFEQDEANDSVTADVRCRIVEYVKDTKKNKIVSGNDTENFVTYRVVLKRPVGTFTIRSEGLTAQNCPYCGATVNINKTAKCEYCGRILDTDVFDWLIDSCTVVEASN